MHFALCVSSTCHIWTKSCVKENACGRYNVDLILFKSLKKAYKSFHSIVIEGMEVPVYLCTEINQERATCTFLSFLHTKMKVYVQTFFGKNTQNLSWICKEGSIWKNTDLKYSTKTCYLSFQITVSEHV